MANEYEWNVNPIQDVLLNAMFLGANIAHKKYKRDVRLIFTYIIQQYLKNSGDVVYLDFDIVKTNEHYKVIGNNIVSALWLSGILPDNPTKVMEANMCNIENRKYSFDAETKTLKFEIK